MGAIAIIYLTGIRPIYFVGGQMGEERMKRERKVNFDPAAHQPSKAEMEEDVSIDAPPESLAWAVTRGGAKRRVAGE